MTKEEFITHLTTYCACIVIREDNAGYTVVRNVINGKMSGVSSASNPNGQLRPATICRICRTLGVENIPEEAATAVEIVDYVHKNHSGDNK